MNNRLSSLFNIFLICTFLYVVGNNFMNGMNERYRNKIPRESFTATNAVTTTTNVFAQNTGVQYRK